MKISPVGRTLEIFHGCPVRLRKFDVRDVSGNVSGRVFLVSGVVKTVFSRFKKKVREFFCFSPRTKESNAGLRGTFQIATFPYGNAENMFYNFVVLCFSSVRNGGRNSMRVQ
jgi:hypothetical protein